LGNNAVTCHILLFVWRRLAACREQ
jgi:hypothetical protein